MRVGEDTRRLSHYRWELVIVDDGSSDATIEKLKSHRQHFSGPVCVVQFARNFGHQPALTAGLQRASGDAVICLDADLQDPPELIAEFLTRFEQGYDVVYAVRRSRRENVIKQALYKAFYRLFSWLSAVSIRWMPVISG